MAMTRAELVLKEAREARAHAWAMVCIAEDAAFFLPEGDPRRTVMLYLAAGAEGVVQMLDGHVEILSGTSAPLFTAGGTTGTISKEGERWRR